MNKVDTDGILNDLYDVLCIYQTSAYDITKVNIGEKRKCRFCSNTDVKCFRKTAHAIPEFLGNKCIVSLDECDHCNNKFSKYESELASFLGPYLAMGKIKGKRGLPKVKGVGFELTRSDKKISISSHKDINDAIYFDPFTNTLKLRAHLPKHKFVPRDAYKALCKIALSILPEDELENFEKLSKWILDQNDEEDFHYLECSFAQTEIYHHLPLVGAYILRRKDERTEVPYMIFVLMASTFCLQIDLMSDSRDLHIDYIAPNLMRLNKNVIIGSGVKQILIQYRNEIKMNWASTVRSNILIDSFDFNITSSSNIVR